VKKVKILVSMAGSNFVWQPGDEVEVSAAEARRLIAAGFAAEVKRGKAEKSEDDPGAEK
jgi:hypothetical protein